MEKDEKINLEDIKEFSKSTEFRKELSDWIETKGIPQQLQSRLRRDLIENFNRTSLGRHISSEFQADHRMTLSPLILALNTLVAEFLYAQNCHYSLSVFSTEVPYKNTMPEFEKREHFRFNTCELLEIFEAIGIDKKTETINQISKLYMSDNPKVGSNSLLYCFIKLLLKSTNENIEKVHNKEIHKSIVPTIKCLNCVKLENEKKNKFDENCNINTKTMKYLNKYLDSLTLRIKEMYEHIPIAHRREDKIKSIEKLELINKSLDKITEEVKLIDQSNKDGRRTFDIVKSINKLTLTFENCAKNIENLIKIDENKIKNQNQQRHEEEARKDKKQVPQTKSESNDKIINKNVLSYQQWIVQLKESKNGQKFLKKLETSLLKTLAQEKHIMEKSFKQNLEKERNFMKLHYRQKYLEQKSSKFENIETKESNNAIQKEAFKEFIEDKFKLLDHREQEIQKKIILKKDNPNIEKINETNITTTQEIKKPSIKNLSKHLVVNINIKPETTPPKQKITPTEIDQIIELDKIEHTNIDLIVLDARERLKHLETESEQLDQSFQKYLQRQNTEKTKLKMDVNKIWENYDYGRKILSKKIKTTTTRQTDLNYGGDIFNHENLNKQQLPQTDPKKLMEMTKYLTEDLDIKFHNPFKNFDPQVYLLETRKESIPINSNVCHHHQSHPLMKKSFDMDTELDEIRKKFLPQNIHTKSISIESNFCNISMPREMEIQIPTENKEKEYFVDSKSNESTILKSSHEKDEIRDVPDYQIKLNEASSQSLIPSEYFPNDISLDGDTKKKTENSAINENLNKVQTERENMKIEENLMVKTESDIRKTERERELMLSDEDDALISIGTVSKSSGDFWD